MKIMMIMSVWLAAACLAGAVEVGDDVLASGCLDGCEVSAFGRKLLAGATYLEDAYLKMQAKWIKQQIKINGIVAKLADGREVTLVWPLERCDATDKEARKAEKAEDIYERLVNQERPHFFEEIIVQHPAVSAIYPYAINTVRLVTIQREGKVHVASACCRFGNYGHSVDNFNNGGMTAPVDEKTGEITDFPIDKTKVLYEKHPMTGAVFKGFVFPMWDQVLEMCTKAAMVVPQVGFIGWDVCITPDGPVIVEGNDYPGHDLYQLPEHTHDKKGIWPKYQF